jgi:5-methylcytosine-specific restriction endonuclease McrA
MESDRSRQSVGSKVLVLNTTCLPINICSWKRAIVLVIKGKAEGLESGKKSINNGKYFLPLVIKLRDYVPIPYNGVVFTRKNIFLRDNYTCQYCGKTKNLTIDHVIPKSKGGEDVWENVVSCCVRCNNKKGDRMPEEEGMKLMGTPYRPPSSLYLQITRQASVPKSWFTYFFKSAASN